ncbi:MAG: hypothetical protein LUC43_03685, partial [Burkholderiales bacterium]|nr:hypothetical protein [Burkholderiales bacterium]
MISGLPPEVIFSSLEILRNQPDPLSENLYSYYFDLLYPLVKPYEWRWKELDFWSPIFKEMQTAPSLVYVTDCCCTYSVTPEYLVKAISLEQAKTFLPLLKEVKNEEGFLRHLKTHNFDFKIRCRNLFMDGLL